MSFIANSFIFNDVPSEIYDLVIITENGAAVVDTAATNSVNLYTDEIYRNPKPYFYGVQQTPVLTFSLTFGSLKPIDRIKQQDIQEWLFGQMNYKKLQIMQCDMYDVYFNCFLTDPKATYVGGVSYAFKCTVTCDAPWAWAFEKTKSFGPFSTESNFTINNTSNNLYYTYPFIELKLSQYETQVSLKNTTDNNTGFSFIGLQPSEILTIDCEKYIIKSNTGLLRLDNMSGSVVQLLNGINSFHIIGSVEYIKFTYRDARKVTG